MDRTSPRYHLKTSTRINEIFVIHPSTAFKIGCDSRILLKHFNGSPLEMNGIVRMKGQAYQKFLTFALQHAHPTEPRTNWQEVLAVLVGQFNDQDDAVEIIDVIPLATGSGYHVEAHDYTTIFTILSPERLERGEFIVGWIHTHPGLGLFLSSTDVRTQALYQRLDPRSIAIVCDPTKITDAFPGMRAFRVTNTEHPASNHVQELPMVISDLETKYYTDIHQNIITEVLKEARPPSAPPLISSTDTPVRLLYLAPNEMLRVVKLAKHDKQYIINLQWICPQPTKELTIKVQLLVTPSATTTSTSTEMMKIGPTLTKEEDHVTSATIPTAPPLSEKTRTSLNADHLKGSQKHESATLIPHEMTLRLQTPPPSEWPPSLTLPVMPIATWTISQELLPFTQILIKKGMKTFPPLMII